MKCKKRVLSALLALCMLVSLLPAGAFAAWDGSTDTTWSGSGTQGDPYQISSAEQLAGLAEAVNGGDNLYNKKYFKLTADIDLGNQAWTPIGTGGVRSTFEGTFDGDGHYITGLYVSGSEKYAGLFGYIYGARILNLGVYGSVSTTYKNDGYAGGIVGNVAGSSHIANCASGVTVSGQFAGGVVGYLTDSSYLLNCYSTGAVTSNDSADGYAGGIAGGNLSTIANCYSISSAEGGFYNGMIAGYNSGGTINPGYYLKNENNAAFGYGSSGTLAYYFTGANSHIFLPANDADQGKTLLAALNDNKSNLAGILGSLGVLPADWAVKSGVNNGYPVFASHTEPSVIPAVTQYPVWVGGVQVTSENAGNVLGDGKVSYDADKNILSLNNANITGGIVPDADIMGMTAGIYAEDSVTIKFTGDNTISAGIGISCGGYDSGALTLTGETKDSVLRVESALAISTYDLDMNGKGTIQAIGESSVSDDFGDTLCMGILAYGTLTASSGEISVVAESTSEKVDDFNLPILALGFSADPAGGYAYTDKEGNPLYYVTAFFLTAENPPSEEILNYVAKYVKIAPAAPAHSHDGVTYDKELTVDASGDLLSNGESIKDSWNDYNLTEGNYYLGGDTDTLETSYHNIDTKTGDVRLCLNNKTLQPYYSMSVNRGSVFTITDCGTNGKISRENLAIAVEMEGSSAAGKLILESGHIEITTAGEMAIWNKGVTVLKGGTVTGYIDSNYTIKEDDTAETVAAKTIPLTLENAPVINGGSETDISVSFTRYEPDGGELTDVGVAPVIDASKYTGGKLRVQVSEYDIEDAVGVAGIKISDASADKFELVNEGYRLVRDGEYLVVQEAPSHSHDGVIFDTEWSSNISEDTTISASQNIVLTSNVNIGGNLTISGSGTVVNLCLNDKLLYLYSGKHITVGAGATLNIYDCGTAGKLNGSYSEVYDGLINASGTVNIYGGTIQNGNSYGRTIFVNTGGTLAVSGGAVKKDSSSTGGGSAVYCLDGTVNITGGTVDGGKYDHGLYLNELSTGGRAAITGGTVTCGVEESGYYAVTNQDGVLTIGGTATISNTGKGNAVYIQPYSLTATTEINGGSIIADNNAAVRVVSSGNTERVNTVTLSGNPSIKGNADKGDVYLEIANTSRTITAILNAANYSGGALKLGISAPTAFMTGETVITGSNDLTKFSLLPNTYKYILQASGNNLILGKAHEHNWSNTWSSDGTAHWHDCTAANCTITDNTKKDGYEAHTAPADDGDCTTAVTCATCGYVFTEEKIHALAYAAKDNIITETCSNSGCTHTATAVIAAPAGTLVYDGTTAFAAAVSYSDGWTGAKDLVISYTKDGVPTADTKGAGNYTASITIGGKTASTTYSVAKAEVTEPTIASKTYSGSNQTAEITDTGLYTVKENNGGTDFGTYNVVLELKDSDNYKWVTTDTKETTLQFHITADINAWTITPAIDGWTYGNPKDPTGTAKYGTVMFTYYDSDKKPLSAKPANAGAYYMKATVAADGNNYAEIQTEYIEFTIAKAKITKPFADNTIFEYNGNEQLYTIAENNVYTVSGNKRTDAGTQQVTVSLKDKDNYQWQDETNADESFTFTIHPKEITIDWVADDFTYNGADQKAGVTASYQDISGDSVSLAVSLTGEFKNYNDGGYTFTAAFANGETNYKLPGAPTKTYHMKKAVPANTDTPVIAAPITYGATLSEIAIGAWVWTDGNTVPTVINSGYTAQLTVDDHNYDYAGVSGYADGKIIRTVAVPVNKADYNMTGITFTDGVFAYDGNGHSLAVSGTLPTGLDGIPVTVSYSGSATNVADGEQIVTAVFATQSTNYNLPAAMTAKVKINPKDISGAAIELDNSLTYTGSEQTQNIKALVVDGLTVTYDISGNTATDVGAQDYMLTVTGNGNFAGSVTKTWNIAKENAVITVDDTPITKTYGDTWELPKATTNFGTVTTDKTVSDMVNAGTYTVVYSVAETQNYSGDTKTVTVTIHKQKVNEPIADSTAFIYNGKEQTYSIAADNRYTVANDKRTDAGSQEVTVILKDTVNYEWAIGGAENKIFTFAIAQKDITNAEITLGETLTYTGTEQTQTIAGIVADGLTVTYDVTGNTATDHKAEGDYILIVTGNGNFTGTQTAEWNIAKSKYIIEESNIPQAGRIRRGSKLSDSKITPAELKDENGNVLGTFAWATPDDEMNENGDFTKQIKFTPVDTNNYNETIFEVSVNVYIPSSNSGGGGGMTRYTVTFDTQGGSRITNKTVNRNTAVSEPTEPTREGYTFEGWFTDKGCTEEYNFSTKVTKNITLYAKWTENKEEPTKPTAPTDLTEPEEWENPFTDVEKGNWYYEDVKFAEENGLFSGTSKTTFAPNSAITRGMLVTVLYRAEGEPAPTGTATFADINANAYYAKAVVWGQQNGIIKGYSDTEFAPDQNITREQIAAIMYRYAEHKGTAPTGAWAIHLDYVDLDQISEYAAEAVMYCTVEKIMQGKDGNCFAPQANATRAEVAAILHRFIESNKYENCQVM